RRFATACARSGGRHRSHIWRHRWHQGMGNNRGGFGARPGESLEHDNGLRGIRRLGEAGSPVLAKEAARELNRKFSGLHSASFAVLPPSPIPGLGNAFGFQMMVEDRRGVGLRELQKMTQSIMGAARDKRGFLRTGFITFSDNSPQIYIDIDR